MHHTKLPSLTAISTACVLALAAIPSFAVDGTWNGTTGAGWISTTNWFTTPTGSFPGSAPLANPAGEGLSTDIAIFSGANSASNVGINMNSLAAAGGVGLSLGGIDYSRTSPAVLQIGNISTTVNGILQLNGATISSVSNTLIRAAGSGDLAIANVNTGSGSQTMGLRLGVNNGIMTVDSGRILTISSIISDGGSNFGFSKTGPGTIVLSGANSYGGGFTLSAGTVVVGNNSAAFGTGPLTINAGTVTFQNGANVTTSNTSTWNGSFNLSRGATGSATWNVNGDVTLGGNVTLTYTDNTVTTVINGNIGQSGGARSLSISANSGSVTLAGANTHSGGTTFTAGTLNINNGGSGGTSSAIGTGTLNISGGTINNTSGNPVTLSTNNPVNITGNFVFTGSNALNLGTGDWSISGPRTITVNGSTLTLGGNQTNAVAGGISKVGAGTLVLGGSNVSTGNNTVSAGVLNIRHNGALGASSGTTSVTAGAALELQGGLTGVNEAITLNGSGVSSGGALRNVSGNNTLLGLVTLASASRINSDAGLLTIDPASGNAVTGTFALTFGGAGDVSVNDPIAITTGTLTKDGTGTLTLAGTHPYTGATAINAGKLLVNGSTATGSAVAVNNTATLGGSGAIGGAVTVQAGGTLASGASIESLATGALTLNAGSNFAYEIDNGAAAGVAGDLTAVTGNLTIAASNNVNLTLSELGSGAWTLGEKLTLISYSGTWNGGLFDFGGDLADDSQFAFSGVSWEIDYNDSSAGSNFTGDLTGTTFVTITVVPEPATLGLLGVGSLLAARRRRVA